MIFYGIITVLVVVDGFSPLLRSSSSSCSSRRRHHRHAQVLFSRHSNACRSRRRATQQSATNYSDNDEDEEPGDLLPRQPNKLDLYAEEELANLLKLHKDLYPSTADRSETEEVAASSSSSNNNDSGDFSSLHDLVLQTVDAIEQAQEEDDEDMDDDDTGSNASSPCWLPPTVHVKVPQIRAIASDVDGTIIGSDDQQIHPRTLQAVVQAVEVASANRQRGSCGSDGDTNKGSDDDLLSSSSSLQWFFPATGKSRRGALSSMGPKLASLLQDGPGVFCQGLYCILDGKVIFEKKLSKAAVEASERLVDFTGTSIIAYDGDDLYTTKLTPTVVELHEIWGEPLSVEIESIAGHAAGVHKIIVCDNDVEKLTKVVRPQLEQVAGETGSVVTQAVPTMLEILPEGCSKALGVRKLCQELGIDPETQLLAIGDAENDVEMLEMAAIGAAVGNANNLAKKAADVVVPLTSSEGGAGLVIETMGGI